MVYIRGRSDWLSLGRSEIEFGFFFSPAEFIVVAIYAERHGEGKIGEKKIKLGMVFPQRHHGDNELGQEQGADINFQ